MRFLPFALFMTLASVAAAQAPATDVDPSTNTGLHVGSVSVPLGAVNQTNGNLGFSIPLASLPGRNGAGFTVSLQYDSKVWSPRLVNDTQSGEDTFVTWEYEKQKWRVGDMGWHLSLPTIQSPEQILDEQTGELITYGNWIVTLGDGTKHVIDGGWQDGIDSEDGDAIKMTRDMTAANVYIAVLGDGTRVRFESGVVTTITDRNGNATTISSDGTITDSAGHQLKLLSVPNGTWDANYTGVQYQDTSGTWRTINFNFQNEPTFQSASITTPFALPVSTTSCGHCLNGYIHVGIVSTTTTYSMLSGVTFPDASYAYQFSYNPYSEITKVTYPGGGYGSYDYQAYAIYSGGIGPVTVYSDFREVVAQHLCDKTSCQPSEEVTTHWAPGSIPNQGNSQITQTDAYGTSFSHDTIMVFDGGSDGTAPAEKLRQVFDHNGTLIHQVTTTNSNLSQSHKLWPTSSTTWWCLGSSSRTSTVTSTFDVAQLYVRSPGVAWASTLSLVNEQLNQVVAHNLYDWVDSPACSATATPNVGTLLRTDLTSFHSSDSTYGTQSTAHIPSIPVSKTVKDASGSPVTQIDYTYDEQSLGSGAPGGNYRGNLTKTVVSGGTGALAASATTHATYNSSGAVLTTVDPKTSITTLTYGTGADPYPSVVERPQTGAVRHRDYYSYDSYTGLPTAHVDQNGSGISDPAHKTSYTYDSMLRIQQVDLPPTQAGSGRTSFAYTPTQTALSVKRSSTDPDLQSLKLMDGLGRTIDTQTLGVPAPCSGNVIHRTTSYNALGQTQAISNPYCSTSEATYGSTQFTYDAVGRLTDVLQPDNASVQHTDYAADVMDSYDEMGVHTRRTTDAAGHLKKVVELGTTSLPLNLQTLYGYDTLGNLSGVNQLGAAGETARVRSFIYDGLSRLITSTNPETGTLCYGQASGGNCTGGYDANGNLLYKTDARGVVTSYTYDALNRLTNKFYSDGTYPSSFAYDGYRWDGSLLSQQGFPAQNVIGRLTSEENRVNFGVVYSYDAMGRVTTQNQFGQVYGWGGKTVSAQYDLAGNMTDLIYPDGRPLKQCFDSAGRLSSSRLDSGGACPSQNYVQSISYLPDGSPNTLVLGNGVQETISKNNRLQVANMLVSAALAPFNGQTFLSHTYCYVGCATGGTADNGNIWAITDNRNGSRTQGFTYDALNRIKTFTTGSGSQTFNIDSFGNMCMAAGCTPSTVFAANNRLASLPCVGYSQNSSPSPYDLAGNQLCSLDSNGVVTQYNVDAENRIRSINACCGNSPSTTYNYGADGVRGDKINADGTWYEWVTFNGQTIAERDQTGLWTDHVYANGVKVADIASADTRIHLSGTNCTGCGQPQAWAYNVNIPANLQIQSGAKIAWRQYQSGPAHPQGGVGMRMTDGTYTNWWITDQDGQQMNNDSTQNSWHQRIVSLDPVANKTVAAMWVNEDGASGAGNWDEYYADLALIQPDGTVVPLLTGQQNVACCGWGQPYVTNQQYALETVPAGQDPTGAGSQTTHFYVGDHLGTASMEFSSGGWPVWQGQFAPFGQELQGGQLLDPTAADGSSNHYKFTGKERDAESGLDYFGARYYASNMGRWMSPDWAEKPEAVPYSKLGDPQSLNLYGYVGNNPLSRFDGDGHQPMTANLAKFNASEDKPNEFGYGTQACAMSPLCTSEAEANGYQDGPSGPRAQQQSSSSTGSSNPNAAAEQHQYDLVVGRVNKLLGTDDAADHIDPGGKLVGGNYEFSINNADKSDAAFRSSLNGALGEADGNKGAHSGHGFLGLQPPSHRVGFSTSLHHDNDALHVDHFNGGSFPIGTLLHVIVDVGIGHLPYYGSNHAFSYGGVQ